MMSNKITEGNWAIDIFLRPIQRLQASFNTYLNKSRKQILTTGGIRTQAVAILTTSGSHSQRCRLYVVVLRTKVSGTGQYKTRMYHEVYQTKYFCTMLIVMGDNPNSLRGKGNKGS